MAGAPAAVVPLAAALMLASVVPAERVLPGLPAPARADYDSRFSTGFSPLSETFIRQVLGQDPLLEDDAAAAVPTGGDGSVDPLAHLRSGSGITITPDPPPDPVNFQPWRSRDPSISADGSRVAYLTTDTRILGDDPLESCYAHPPGATYLSIFWYYNRGQFGVVSPTEQGPCDQIVVQESRPDGQTWIASVGRSGKLANSPVQRFMLSGNGRYVAFSTAASNIVPNDTNDTTDVFLRDLATGRTELISESIHGGPIRPHDLNLEQIGGPVDQDFPDVLGSNAADWPTVSHDGRYVLFESSANDLVKGDTTQSVDVFVRDRLRGSNERVSLSSSGHPARREDVRRDNNQRLSRSSALSAFPCMSANGRYIAWRSWGSNLVPGDRNELPDIFFRDLRTGRTELVTVSTAEEQQNDGEARPGAPGTWHEPWVFSLKHCISNDGRYVVFDSRATNLVEDDTNETGDIFLRDRAASTTRRVSLNSDGTQATISNEGFLCLGTSPTCEEVPPPTGEAASLSPDGRFIAFHSMASLTPDDPDRMPLDNPAQRDPTGGEGGGSDLFLHEIASATLIRLPVEDFADYRLVDHDAAEFRTAVMGPHLTAGGSVVAFKSVAKNGVHFTGAVHLYRWRDS